VWVNNTGLGTFTNGTSTITLPAGLQLHAGETAAKAIGNVGPGTVKQASWSVDITGGKGTYDYSVTSAFAAGSGPLTATARLVVGDINTVYLPIALK